MNSSTSRVLRYKKRQLEAGRKPHVVWLRPEILQQLKRVASGKTIGERIEKAVTLITNPYHE